MIRALTLENYRNTKKEKKMAFHLCMYLLMLQEMLACLNMLEILSTSCQYTLRERGAFACHFNVSWYLSMYLHKVG